MRTRIKICGITRAQDAVAAAEAGADAIGLVFYPKSPRYVTPDAAVEIIAALPVLTVSVGLFMDADPDWVAQVLKAVPLDALQFHGNESAAECERHGRRYIKAVGMAGGDANAVAAAHPNAAALLLDGHAPGRAGGSGETFDWQQPVPETHRVIVAGGLTADNVAQAVQALHPWGVDCSSGVESAPGIKDRRKLVAFSKEVYRVERH